MPSLPWLALLSKSKSLPSSCSWQIYYHSSRKITSVPPIVRWGSNIWTGEGEEGQFNYLHHGSFSSPRTDLRVEIPRPATLIWILLPLFSPWVILSRSLKQFALALLFEGISTVCTHHKQFKALLKFWGLSKGFPVNKSGVGPENLHFKHVPRWRRCCC